MTALDRLWAEYRLPLGDALHINADTSYGVSYEPPDGASPETGKPYPLRIGDPFDLEAELEGDPDETSEVDGQRSLELPEGGCLWAGEGSHGSEGFCARLTSDRSLVWAVFLTDSDPFTEIQLTGRTATFISTTGVVLTIDIDGPLRRPTMTA